MPQAVVVPDRFRRRERLLRFRLPCRGQVTRLLCLVAFNYIVMPLDRDVVDDPD